jgi:hypothetical protein
MNLKEKFTWVDFDQAIVKMDAWLLAHPGRKKTRRFIVNWLNKIDKPMNLSGGSLDTVDKRISEAREAMKKHGYT